MPIPNEVVKNRIETSNTPAKLPKVPGAGHFLPTGPRVAKKRIPFGSITIRRENTSSILQGR